MIPNFCLGSHPSRIPLILHGLYFCFQLIKAPYIVFHIFSFFSLTFSTPFFIFFSFLPLLFLFFFFFFAVMEKERLQLLHPPTVPFSSYLPWHLRDHRLQDVLGFEAYMEFMGCLKETDIQWVVEWWHILSMVHNCC